MISFVPLLYERSAAEVLALPVPSVLIAIQTEGDEAYGSALARVHQLILYDREKDRWKN